MVGFFDVYGWLNQFEEVDSYLGVPQSRLIALLKESLIDQHQDYAKAQEYINLSLQVAESLNDSVGSFNKAEIHIECACAYYQMGELLSAGNEFRRAANFYQSFHPHNTAVANWLQGCVYWRRAKISDGIIMWERCCEIFRSMIVKSRQSNWYAEKSNDLCDTLQNAIEAGRWPYE